MNQKAASKSPVKLVVVVVVVIAVIFAGVELIGGRNKLTGIWMNNPGNDCWGEAHKISKDKIEWYRVEPFETSDSLGVPEEVYSYTKDGSTITMTSLTGPDTITVSYTLSGDILNFNFGGEALTLYRQ